MLVKLGLALDQTQTAQAALLVLPQLQHKICALKMNANRYKLTAFTLHAQTCLKSMKLESCSLMHGHNFCNQRQLFAKGKIPHQIGHSMNKIVSIHGNVSSST